MLNLKHSIRASWLRRRAAAAAIVLASSAAWALLGSTTVTAASGPAATPGAASASGLARLPGHVNGRARPQFDVGAAPDSLAMNGLEIVFAKTPAQERALEQLIAAQQDPKSPQYHKWLKPADYGARFGASPATVAAVTQWLEASGFRVDALPANRSQLRFHGTKAQVEAAFHTEIHLFRVNGVQHFSNVSDPEVPAALAPAIATIHGLHDFYPKSTLKSRPAHADGAQPQITFDGGTINYVGPGDFAVMYNLGPLYAAGINGQGITIGIAGQSDINPAVAASYWAGVGVTTPPALQSMLVPGGTDPHQTNDSNEAEAYLDIELAGALAPGASILLVREANAMNAAEYIIQQNLASVLNISFHTCESTLGAANSAVNSLFQEAVTQGMTVIVSSDDEGVAGCQSNPFTQGTLSTTGFAVSGLASTPYDLAVGGTDFDPTKPGDWSGTNAPGTLANALAHIPEMVWNNSCANPVGTQFLGTTPSAFCNQTTFNGNPNPFLQVAGSGGGLSSCLSLDASNVCQGGYAQPSWQMGVNGIGNFGTRAIPDVAVIADGWVMCSYDNATCTPATNGDFDVVQGTSAAAPSVAAIIALLDQQMGGRQGLVNPQLYQLAAAEYGTSQAPNAGAAGCSASLGITIGANCVFYNVTAGSNAQPCQVAGYNQAGTLPASTCNAPAGDANGIMSVNGASKYAAGTGYSLAAGLGSINAANLVLAIYLPAPTGLSATTSGQSVTLNWTGEPHAITYDVYQASASGQEGSTPVQTGVNATSTTVSGLQFAQTYYFTVAAQAAAGISAQSGEVQVMTVPAAPAGLTAKGGNAMATLSWTASSGATGYNIYQGTSAGGEGATAVQSGVSGVTATVSGLTNGTTYYFTVAAVDGGGASAPSNEAQAAPAAPAKGGGGALGPLETVLIGLLAAVTAARRARSTSRRPSRVAVQPLAALRRAPRPSARSLNG